MGSYKEKDWKEVLGGLSVNTKLIIGSTVFIWFYYFVKKLNTEAWKFLFLNCLLAYGIYSAKNDRGKVKKNNK